jgi:hypothetical protein
MAGTRVLCTHYLLRVATVVERFMQHLNGCLTKGDDSQYKSMKDFLPAIAFAHNTAFNSAINCTPFEAGHGLRAKTKYLHFEVSKIFPDEVEVAYYTTPKPLMEGHANATLHQRIDDFLKARFRKTWFVYAGQRRWERNIKTSVPVQSQASTLDGETTRQRDRRFSYRHEP